MKKDPLVSLILRTTLIKDTSRNYDLLFTFLYNFIPAFIIAPYLIIIGIQYALVPLLVIGIILFLVDLMHFIREMKRIFNQTVQ